MAGLSLESPRWCHIVQWHDPTFRQWHQRRFISDIDARKFAERIERERGEWVHVHSIPVRWSQPQKSQVTWREGHQCSGHLRIPTGLAGRRLILT